MLHIKRHDSWVNLAQQLATIAFWIHPGVHWLNRQIGRAREEICDNFVLKQAVPSDYAHLLLELAEKCTAWQNGIRVLGVLGSRWTLENRVAGLLNPERQKLTHTKLRDVAIIALVLGSVPMAVGGVGAFQEELTTQRLVPTVEMVEAQLANSESPLDAGQAVPEIGTQATIPAPTTKEISVRGTCLGADRKPISSANVRVFQYRSFDQPIIRAETRTDAEGHFALRGVRHSADPGDLCVAVAAHGYVSAVQTVKPTTGDVELPIELSGDVGTLSGVVTNAQGQPVKDAVVFLNRCYGRDPLPGIFAAVTDTLGRYAITDVKRWSPEQTKATDPKTGMSFMTTRVGFVVEHPDYPRTTAWTTAIPQTVAVTLKPAAVVEGRVIDSVTQKAVANVVVSVRGLSNTPSSKPGRTAMDVIGSR